MAPLCAPASCSAITPVFCLSHLISFCHLRTGPGSFFHHPPISFSHFIGAVHCTLHVSLPLFYPSSCRSLNPSHLLSQALIPPAFLLLCPAGSCFHVLSHFHLLGAASPQFFLVYFFPSVLSSHNFVQMRYLLPVGLCRL